MDIFQLTFILLQIAIGLIILAIPAWMVSRVIRFMTKSTRKTYSSFRG